MVASLILCGRFGAILGIFSVIVDSLIRIEGAKPPKSTTRARGTRGEGRCEESKRNKYINTNSIAFKSNGQEVRRSYV
jgi:hypothetical protein